MNKKKQSMPFQFVCQHGGLEKESIKKKHGGYKNRGDDEKGKKCCKVISRLSEQVEIL